MSFKPCACPQAPKLFFRAANRSWPIDIVWPKTNFVKQIPSCGWIKILYILTVNMMYVHVQLFLCLLTKMETWPGYFLQAFSSFLFYWALTTVTKFSNLNFGYLHCISCPDFSIHILYSYYTVNTNMAHALQWYFSLLAN